MSVEQQPLSHSMYHSTDIAYCSNVHAGESLADIVNNLHRFVKKVRHHRRLESMTSGFWISAAAAKELQDTQALKDFKQALTLAGLTLSSINGFPYGGFHQEKLKADVYIPDWSDSARLIYTQQLAEILAACLPEGVDIGAISSVPLGYKYNWNEEKQHQAIQQLTGLMFYLLELEQRTGKRILLCLEMEPDCVLESSIELIRFFQEFVQPKIPHNQYLGCCFDACHQAVMHENIYDALQGITTAGIHIGKIQLSSALQARFEPSADGDAPLVALLAQFCEPKYLHQVKSLDSQGMLLAATDLAVALKGRDLFDLQAFTWRIHFHVPIHFQHLIHPKLQTTGDDLLKVFDFLSDHQSIRPLLEVETYTWQVLPESIRPHNDNELIDGIVKELCWVEEQLMERGILCHVGNDVKYSGNSEF